MEYIFYIIPFIENHDSTKHICYSFHQQPKDIEHILSNTTIEDNFQSNQLCLKCAFYCQLWYDSMILEKRTFTYSLKSMNSKYAFKEFDLISDYENVTHPTLHYISPIKASNTLHTLLTKRAYTTKDIEAYDKTIEIVKYINDMYQKYKILIFYEEYF